jgi:hypothetical protein
MTRRAHRPRGRGPRRKWDDFAISHTFTGASTGVTEVYDVIGGSGGFTATFGSRPHQATLSIPRFDMSTLGTGTGTNVNSITLGFCVGPNTLDAADLDPSTNAQVFWWIRKYTLQNNSNPAGALWAIQGTDALNWTVRTRRTLKELGDTLWVAVRPDFTGFTAVATTIDLHVGILYP